MPTDAAAPYARLIAPRRALVSCVPAYIVRSTLGSSGPGLNRYPATPLCSVCWMLHGTMATVDQGRVSEDMVAGPGDVIFSGPQRQPWTTCNAGPAHFFVAMFYPDALHAQSGVDLSAWVDRFAPADQLFGPAWRVLADALMGAASDDGRAALVDDFLVARWQAARGQAPPERGGLGDWVRRLGVQAASNGIGRSVRVAERRVKIWAGLPMRTLQRMGRAEQALLAARAELDAGHVSWVDVAANAGYADQSHLTRETRALTGLAPAALAQRMAQDDSYWMYRIWS